MRCPKYFWTLEFAETGGHIFASYDACLTVAFSPLDFAVCVMSGFWPSLVVNARRANLHLRAPELVALLMAAPFAKLEIQLGETLHCLQFDLANAFHRIELPMGILEFFSACPGWKSTSSASRRWMACQSTTRHPSSHNSVLCRWRGRMLLLSARTILSRVARLSAPVSCVGGQLATSMS